MEELTNKNQGKMRDLILFILVVVLVIVAMAVGVYSAYRNQKQASALETKISELEVKLAEAKSSTTSQTVTVKEADYDACFIATETRQIRVLRGSNLTYCSKLYIKGNICWYEDIVTKNVYVALLQSCTIVIEE